MEEEKEEEEEEEEEKEDPKRIFLPVWRKGLTKEKREEEDATNDLSLLRFVTSFAGM